MSPLSRREALARVGRSALFVSATAVLGRAAWDPVGPRESRAVSGPGRRDLRVRGAEPGRIELAIASGGPAAAATPEALTRRAIAALGGMDRFVSRGDVVAIKPNVGWDRTPAQAANTNPRVVAELVRLALGAGAKRVVVTDIPCNEPARCFERSGIGPAAHEAGAEVVLPAEHLLRTVRLGGEVLDEWPVHRPLLEADKVIGVPVAKHHGLTRYTGALKNWYGLLGGRRDRLHQRIDESIADLAAFLQPTLTVVDATRVLLRGGPQGGNLADTLDARTVIASVDQVAADACACRLIGVVADELPYLALAERRGLGTRRWDRLRWAQV
ncbi:MAG: DUF362 domain-containing protein [Deltaproteobacteria bacterium]|nr:DUF362 domain-containing protein [Deltaproteobacteria bacterium]